MYTVDAAVTVALIVLTAACVSAAAGNRRRVEERGGDAARGEVTYDGRALVVNGTRRMLFSGEMHYTRSTPEVLASVLHSALRFAHLLDCVLAINLA